MTIPIKVSIIIPVYNADTSLQTCLDAATRQTLNDIEIICVDDCSTDTSAEILLNYSTNDKRIRLLKHNENKGEGDARNTGINNAKGEYIFHLDADDTIPHEAMEKLYNEAHNNDSDMVKGRYDLIYGNGTIQQQLWSAPGEKIINTNIDQSEFLQQIPTSHCTYLYKRQFLNQHNIRYRTDLVVGLDLIALATALLNAMTVTLIPDLVYYYHQSEASVTRGKITAKIAKDAIRSKKVVSDMLNQRGMHDAANSRLQKWEFIIDAFLREMPSSLTLEESRQTFTEFRNLITDYNLVPWTTNTPHHYRYTLALLIAGKDEEALSFLRTKDATEGFSDPKKLKQCLKFVLEQVPGDTGAEMELGRLLRSEGKLEQALDIFEKIIQLAPDNYDAQLQATGTLIQLGENLKAREKLDNTIDNLTRGLDFRQQIKRASTLKEHLGLGENKLELEMLRRKLTNSHDELTSTRDQLNTTTDQLNTTTDQLNTVLRELNSTSIELNTVYNSNSWRLTKPLRKLMAIIKLNT